MRNRFKLLLVLGACVLASSGFAAGKAKHVVMIVWDGMRPDFVSEQNTPTLWELSKQGVTFQKHHSTYLSSTEVNGTSLATGAYPAHDGIMGNAEYRADLDELKSIHTEVTETVRKGDKLSGGKFVRLPTIAELVRKAGGKTAVAGAKPVALLADRAERDSATEGANVFGGETLPANLLQTITNLQGKFPAANATKRTRNDWTAEALIDPLWASGVPEYSLLWMNEPDYSQHFTGTGSKEVLAAIRNADANLARVLKALEAKGVRETTDVILVSDHGCSTVSERVDLADCLTKAGIKAVREFKGKPAKGDVLVVSNGGSTMVYVIGHEEKTIQAVVKFLQGWEHTGVIFTKKAVPGTFAISQVHADAVGAPDVLVSMRWSADKNKNGTPGMVTGDVSGFGPGQGLHVSLSPYDMHNTLIAAGPDFNKGTVDALPSGNMDIAPTVLWILGIKQPKSMDGRVLTEALTAKGPKVEAKGPQRIEAKQELEKSIWQQYLNFSEINGVMYFDEGNGQQLPK
ncbi:MAG: Type phosphodiesterase/nucleotide pyrophosphatase [Pedosphaera sp.]|nr:Type phosphodiesterase/nucleotide pyrophosphatase [Pedosphaera sp.]